MRLKNILNRVERHTSFVYQEARWADPETKSEIEIPIEPRSGGQPICSKCSGLRRFRNRGRWFVWGTATGGGGGFFLHSSLMIEPQNDEMVGLAGAEFFHREPAKCYSP